jgi:tripartite-type tricarboxylate transporter receptor subunit TctC
MDRRRCFGQQSMAAHRRHVLRILAGAATLPIVSTDAFGFDYPTRPVRIIVGFAPGGAPDLIARLIGQWLSERLGQPFIIENHPGVGSNLALEDVAKTAPDGYTLFEVSLANAINESLYRGASVQRDIAPIASIASAAFVIVVTPSFGAQTVPALIAYAKSNPGTLNFGSSPTGTPPYLALSLFKRMADLDFVQVPFRNSVQAVEELLGRRLDVAISDMSAIEYVKAGKLHALAVTTANRQQALPDVPSLAEFLSGYEASTWYGLGAVRNTPPEIIKVLNTAVDAALQDPKHVTRLFALGVTIMVRSSSDFKTFIAGEAKKWGEVIEAAGIKPQ